MSKLLWKFVALSLFLSFPVQARPLRVHLDWIADAEFAGIFVAMEKGWYKEAGIEIELVAAGLDSMPQLPVGSADIGIHSGQEVIRHIDKGTPVQAIAANYQSSPICILAGQNSKINSVKDLKGKTVGIFAPGDYDTFRIMLGNNGLTMADVKFKKIDTIDEVDLVRMLSNKEVDAIPAWEFNWTLTFPLLGYKVKVFPGYDNGFHFYGIVYFANKEAIAKHRALLTQFLKVTMRGWREVFRDVDAAAKLLLDKYYPSDRYVAGSKALTLKQQKMEMKLAKRFFFEGVDKDRIGSMSTWKWKRSLDIAKKYGVIQANSKLQPADVFDDSLFKATFEGSP